MTTLPIAARIAVNTSATHPGSLARPAVIAPSSRSVFICQPRIGFQRAHRDYKMTLVGRRVIREEPMARVVRQRTIAREAVQQKVVGIVGAQSKLTAQAAKKSP